MEHSYVELRRIADILEGLNAYPESASGFKASDLEFRCGGIKMGRIRHRTGEDGGWYYYPQEPAATSAGCRQEPI